MRTGSDLITATVSSTSSTPLGNSFYLAHNPRELISSDEAKRLCSAQWIASVDRLRDSAVHGCEFDKVFEVRLGNGIVENREMEVYPAREKAAYPPIPGSKS